MELPVSDATTRRPDLTLHVVALTRDDVATTSRLHRDLLPNGLFPRLGDRFVRRWHQTFVDDDAAVAIGVRDGSGGLHGFLLGTTDQHGYSARTIRRHGRRLALHGGAALLLRPRLAYGFVRTRAGRYARRLLRRGQVVAPSLATTASTTAGTTGAPTSSDMVGVLHALISVPTSRGRGVGAALVQQFERAARERGTPLLQLVTQAEGGAADFYRAIGWEVTDRRRDRDGHSIVQLDRRIGPA